MVGPALTALLALLALLAPAAHADAETDRAWVQRALALQYELADDVALANAPWISTHNSFNSQAEMGPALSAQDSNQQITIVDQLNEGVRHLEIDPHNFVSVSPDGGVQRVVVCHATNEHAGCTIEKPLITIMRQIRGWLDANPSQVVMLYFDTKLDSVEGHDAAADVLEETVGDRLVRPPRGGTACDPLPLNLTRGDIRAAGKQVLMFGPCGQGSKWPGVVLDERLRLTGADNTAIKPFPDCGPDFTRAQYDTRPIRYFEDATRVGQVAGSADPLTPELAERMSRCGVDLIAFDNLLRGDERLDRLVWSWAPQQPSAAGPCTVQRTDGRWESRSCSEPHRVACRTAAGAWFVPPGVASADSAPGLCAAEDGVHDVPRTGYEGQLLAAAAARDGAATAWLDLRSGPEDGGGPGGGGQDGGGQSAGGPGDEGAPKDGDQGGGGQDQPGQDQGGHGQTGGSGRSQGARGPCMPRHLRATRTRIGRAHIGHSMRRLTRRYRVASRGGRMVRFCVRGGGRFLVGARRDRIDFIASTAPGHRTRRGGPGRLVRDGRIRGARRLRRQLLAAPRRRSGRQVVYGLEGGRVAYLVVAPRKQTARPLRLARKLRSLGLRR